MLKLLQEGWGWFQFSTIIQLLRSCSYPTGEQIIVEQDMV
jgi:hypothetical protein